MLSRLADEKISKVFSQALQQENLITEEDTAVIFYDLPHINERIKDLISLFPETALHTIAIKANPLAGILKQIRPLGAGLEAASLPELCLAEKTGYPSDRIVFDSPVKTIKEIEYALNLGVHINANSLPELERIANLLKESSLESTIGVRINPQTGKGSIAATSVADNYSKFGIALKENRSALIKKFIEYDWLRGVHLHIGSQGCDIKMLLNGIAAVLDFVNEVNTIFQSKNMQRRINIFDMGGGLPVSYNRDKEAVTMVQYSQAVKKRFPQLFSAEFKLITEFGRYIYANAGWAASRVEYVVRESVQNTAFIHAGADLFLRRCYKPEDWHHELSVVDAKGRLKTGKDKFPYTIAGPLCFAGDILARNLALPSIEAGDYIIIHDAGAYTLSMWSRYNSRQIPKVIGYLNDGQNFQLIKKREDLESVIRFWS